MAKRQKVDGAYSCKGDYHSSAHAEGPEGRQIERAVASTEGTLCLFAYALRSRNAWSRLGSHVMSRKQNCLYGLLKIRGPFLGVPIRKIVVFGGLH